MPRGKVDVRGPPAFEAMLTGFLRKQQTWAFQLWPQSRSFRDVEDSVAQSVVPQHAVATRGARARMHAARVADLIAEGAPCIRGV